MAKSNGANGSNGQTVGENGGVFICLYGPSKAGKTVASAAAGSTGVFVGAPSGLMSAKRFLGIEKLNILPARTVPDAIEAIEKAVNKGGVPSIVIDDFSLIVETTINEYEGTKGASLFSTATSNPPEPAVESLCVVALPSPASFLRSSVAWWM